MPIMTMYDGLVMFTAYLSPKDYPDKIVVRRHVVTAHGPTLAQGEPCIVTDTMEISWFYVQKFFDRVMGLHWIGRHQSDDPVIMGVWV